MSKDNSYFEIIPYIGALPIKFGMSINEVKKLIGDPISIEHDELGSLFSYQNYNVMFSLKNEVEEIGFTALIKSVTFKDKKIFGVESNTNPYTFFKKHDKPITSDGAVVFLKLGISLTGYPNGIVSDRALTCFKKGLWDDLL